MTTVVRLTTLTAFLTLVLTWAAGAQNLGQVLGTLAAIDMLTLIPLDDPVLTDPASNESATSDPPRFPTGSKFKLFGAAKRDLDPENPFNEVISFDTNDPNAIAITRWR